MYRILSLTVFFIIFVIAISAGADSNLPPPHNIRITYIPQLNNEEQVFICPTDSNIIIANWRDFRLTYRQVGIGRSTNGGQSWTDSLVASVMQYYLSDSKQSDPTLTVDRLGNFYMCNMDWDAFGYTGQSTIVFYKSIDKGISWTGPYSILNHTPTATVFEDKQFVTVDRTGGLYDGNVYCTWMRFYDGPNRAMFVRSTDGAVNFEDTLVVGPIQNPSVCGVYDAGQFPIPVVTYNGNVHVLWMGNSYDSVTCDNYEAIKHVVSYDGGQSFTYEDIVTPVSGYQYADGSINTYSNPASDADITGGPFNGNLYVAFANNAPEDIGNTDIDFMKSSDNGITWSERLQINDAVESSEIDSFHPWLIVNEEGVIIVLFYDQRFDPPGYLLFDAMVAYSFDGGETFTSNHRISSASSNPAHLASSLNEEPLFANIDLPSNRGDLSPRAGLIGEYIGVTAFHDKINAVWTDSRDGNSEVYTANWYLPVLEPHLLGPDNNAYQTAQPRMEWATSWKHNQDHYRVEVSAFSDFTTNLVEAEVDTNFYVTELPLENGIYYWRVKAFKGPGADSSAYSEVRTFEVDGIPPEPPDLFEPIDGYTTNDNTPFFDWEPAAKNASPVVYDLYISSDAGFPDDGNTSLFSDIPVSEYTLPDPVTEGVLMYWKIIAKDLAGNETSSTVFTFTYISYICGDTDGSQDNVNISDLTYLVNYLFAGGPNPVIMEAADIDGSGGLPNISDLTYLVDFLFAGGPAPQC